MSDAPVWQTLLKSALETDEYEISCEECFNGLDMYAELLIDGSDHDQIMPMIKQHLKHCHCCEVELEALMVMIQEVVEKEGQPKQLKNLKR